MWIRSQDRKSLSNVNGVLMDITLDESSCYIYGFVDRGKDILGTYSTQEKALKVLNEIQHTLSDSVIINGKLYTSPREVNEQHTTTSERIVIYQMPQDEDVKL